MVNGFCLMTVICTLKEQANHKQMLHVMWNLQACATLSVFAYIALEASNVQGGVSFQIVLYYLVPAKQKSKGFFFFFMLISFC